jgi:diguanylate cyclase (GGDEF)-like protein
MSADLGLFNQLLQMIDGDWSDSIKGICRHIHQNFTALGVSLAVFDKNFQEFIYLDYSLDEDIPDKLKKIGIDFNLPTAMDILKKIYQSYTEILEDNIFSGMHLAKLALHYFDGDKEKFRIVQEDIGLKTVASFPVIESNKRYRCVFYIMTGREIGDQDKALLDSYIPQLDVALEIVFLVRELYLKATHDSLTMLFNRKHGESLIASEFERVKRNQNPLCLVLLDLDHFKSVNDTYGHAAGDMVLKTVSYILTSSLRKCDIVCRHGGEEFLLGLVDTDITGALEVTKRLKDRIQNCAISYNDATINITASMGIVQYDPKIHSTLSMLIEHADKKMYAAKNNGRNTIEY